MIYYNLSSYNIISYNRVCLIVAVVEALANLSNLPALDCPSKMQPPRQNIHVLLVVIIIIIYVYIYIHIIYIYMIIIHT